MRKSNYLWLLLVAVLLLPAQEMAAKKKKEKEVTDRELWAGVLYQMAAPVLSNMSEAGGRPGKSGLPTLAERGTAAGRCRLCC